MKELTILLCTPDMHRPVARRCIEFVKKTDLSRAELIIADNAYDSEFNHAKVMDSYIEYAGKRPMIFMDDDIVINDYDWISKLLDTCSKAQASIAGSIHRYETGEVNHLGIIIHLDGTPELIRNEPSGENGFLYAPAVSSALMLIMNPLEHNFDTAYVKYQHDVDICMEAWKRGERTACALDLTITHHLTEYTSKLGNSKRNFEEDTIRFGNKWKEFVNKGLYDRDELAGYREIAGQRNWTIFYNKGSRIEENHPEEAKEIFRTVTKECPFNWLKAGAFLHLYNIDGNREHLKECLTYNPRHLKAREILNNS